MNAFNRCFPKRNIEILLIGDITLSYSNATIHDRGEYLLIFIDNNTHIQVNKENILALKIETLKEQQS